MEEGEREGSSGRKGEGDGEGEMGGKAREKEREKGREWKERIYLVPHSFTCSTLVVIRLMYKK